MCLKKKSVYKGMAVVQGNETHLSRLQSLIVLSIVSLCHSIQRLAVVGMRKWSTLTMGSDLST